MTEQQAMRLALEALEQYHGYMEPLTTVFGGPRVPAEQSTTSKVEKAITALRQALANQALDRMAENARELGLDYEPENTLHWHALNYRTAPTQNAQVMFEALEKFVAQQPADELLRLRDLLGKANALARIRANKIDELEQRLTKTEAQLGEAVWNYGELKREQLANQQKTSGSPIDSLTEPADEPVAWVSTTELLVMQGNKQAGAKDWRINVGLVAEDGDVGLYTRPQPTNKSSLFDSGVYVGSHIGKEIKHTPFTLQPDDLKIDRETIIKLIHGWQAIEETSDILRYHDDFEKRMDISVMRSAWVQMDDLIRNIWEEMGRP